MPHRKNHLSSVSDLPYQQPLRQLQLERLVDIDERAVDHHGDAVVFHDVAFVHQCGAAEGVADAVAVEIIGDGLPQRRAAALQIGCQVAAVVQRLPKTRSGKILRGTMQKIADGDEYRMPATIDDPDILTEITSALGEIGYPN